MPGSDKTLDHLYRPSLFVPFFLCSSVAYYLHDVSVLSDAFFDKMCKEAMGNRPPKPWKAHPHAHFIKRDMLSQGSGYNLPFRRLPGVVHGGAFRMMQMVDTATPVG